MESKNAKNHISDYRLYQTQIPKLRTELNLDAFKYKVLGKTKIELKAMYDELIAIKEERNRPVVVGNF